MPYCPNCGQQVNSDMKFCPSCGAALIMNGFTTMNTINNAVIADRLRSGKKDYMTVLVSLHNCSYNTAQNLLIDVLGYTSMQAEKLLHLIPTQIAKNLTAKQAACLTQMFAEYGLAIAVFDSRGSVDISEYLNTSVFNSNGKLLEKVKRILWTLTLNNHVTEYGRLRNGDLFRYVFTPRYSYRKLPDYRSRQYGRPQTGRNEPPRYSGVARVKTLKQVVPLTAASVVRYSREERQSQQGSAVRVIRPSQSKRVSSILQNPNREAARNDNNRSGVRINNSRAPKRPRHN